MTRSSDAPVNAAALERLGLNGLPVEYDPAFLGREERELVFRRLLDEIRFQPDFVIRKFGKAHVVPRLHAAFGDPGTAYRFSGTRIPALPWTPTLLALRDRVAPFARSGAPINFVLVNYYRSGRDRIGAHSDDERDMIDEPDLFSVSLGAPRDFFIRSRPPVRLVLENGSLLILRHPTNARAKHELPARKRLKLPRLNLTFRQMRPVPG